jgi:hypothetical protein
MRARLIAAASAAVLVILLAPGPVVPHDSCPHAGSAVQNHCGGGKK